MVLKKYIVGTVILWLIYVSLSLLVPAKAAIDRYHLSLVELNLLRATVLIPYLLFWLAATFALVRFRIYSKIVYGSPESRGFNKITLALWALLLVIVLPPLLNLIPAYVPNSLSVQKVATIATNYVTVILYLFAFWQLWLASRNLIKTLESAEGNKGFRSVLFVILAVLAFLYFWVVFHNPYRTVSPNILIKPTYSLPDAMIILTILIPYLLVWLFGVFTITDLYFYAKRVNGVVYKKAFINAANGLIAIIILSVSVQFLSQLSSFFSNASLKVILIIVYLILFAIAAGYLFIARGARQLTDIEKV